MRLRQQLEQMLSLLTILVERGAPVAVKEWFSTKEAAEILKRSCFTVREWCRLGRVNAEKRTCGRGTDSEWMLSADEIERIRNYGLLPAKG